MVQIAKGCAGASAAIPSEPSLPSWQPAVTSTSTEKLLSGVSGLNASSLMLNAARAARAII